MHIVLHPNSGTNKSDKYRVVKSEDWVRYVNGATPGYAFTTHDTYAEAEAVRDKANKL